MIARLEAVLYWLVGFMAVAFIGLAVVWPARVERAMTDILTGIVGAIAGN